MYCGEASIEGTVTSVDTFFAWFQLDDSVKVHMSVRFTEDTDHMLPLVGSKVSIQKGHRCGSVYVPCMSSILEGDFEIQCLPNPFLSLIRRYRLGAYDLFKFEDFVQQLQKNFTTLEPIVRRDMLLALTKSVTEMMVERGHAVYGRDYCVNKMIAKFFLNVMRACKHVEIKTNKYANFPYWSFGSHPSEHSTMLFGFLEIQPIYGFYMLKDSHYQIVVIITTQNSNKSDIEVSRLQNSYVLIENYSVITEIYHDSSIPNVEYIVANVDNIRSIYATSERGSKMFGPVPKDKKYPHVMTFILRKKSSVCVGDGNLPELLLQIFIRFTDEKVVWKEVFLILPSTYVAINLFLKEGTFYIMHFTTPVKEVHHVELKRFKHMKIYEVQGKDCYFQPIHVEAQEMPQILCIQDCKYFVEHLTGLVSFRGVIRSKRFADPLPSRSSKKSTVYGFGTPGTQVHQIVFAEHISRQVIYLDCYLNNWENILMPLGLVPHMDVIVKNVMPQSKRYLKATSFTTFEIVGYKPLFNFNTVNLYKNDKVDWGVPTYLSLGRKIPAGVLVWGSVKTVFMLKVTILSRCAFCKQTRTNPNMCLACKETDRELDFTARFNILDQYGQSSVMSKSFQLLRIFLCQRQRNFDDFVNTFNTVGTYNYNHFEKGTPNYEYITNYLEKVNDKKVYLDLKCRKMGGMPAAEQRPMWYCVDARRR